MQSWAASTRCVGLERRTPSAVVGPNEPRHPLQVFLETTSTLIPVISIQSSTIHIQPAHFDSATAFGVTANAIIGAASGSATRGAVVQGGGARSLWSYSYTSSGGSYGGSVYCSAGTYADTATGLCAPCPANTYAPNINLDSACVPCSWGLSGSGYTGTPTGTSGVGATVCTFMCAQLDFNLDELSMTTVDTTVDPTTDPYNCNTCSDAPGDDDNGEHTNFCCPHLVPNPWNTGYVLQGMIVSSLSNPACDACPPADAWVVQSSSPTFAYVSGVLDLSDDDLISTGTFDFWSAARLCASLSNCAGFMSYSPTFPSSPFTGFSDPTQATVYFASTFTVTTSAVEGDLFRVTQMTFPTAVSPGCCSGSPVDLDTDPNNCGLCGAPGGPDCCGGNPTNLLSDPNNCGVCGRQVAPHCLNGYPVYYTYTRHIGAYGMDDNTDDNTVYCTTYNCGGQNDETNYE